MSSAIWRKFGKRIRRLRLAHEWSQEEFAYRIGMDVSYLSELENGKKEACLTRIHRIAAGFKISLSELMKDV
ncbi:MAG TPA: helix-turn-helix transcriptional regulator [Terriglobales bacterium]|nr:helix-turn-helix transcriptional regulator [Terriglobales bacterium]